MKDQVNQQNKNQPADKNRTAQPADKANPKDKGGSASGRR